MMPNHLDAIDANQVWTAPESDIFPLPVVAIALDVGCNKMCQIPANISFRLDEHKINQ